MARIKRRYIGWEFTAPEPVSLFRVYYASVPPEQVDALPIPVDPATLEPTWPFVSVPFVAGQSAYSIMAPDQIPITDGRWQITITTLDDAGNESEPMAVIRPFDFVPPPPVTNLRIW